MRERNPARRSRWRARPCPTTPTDYCGIRASRCSDPGHLGSRRARHWRSTRPQRAQPMAGGAVRLQIGRLHDGLTRRGREGSQHASAAFRSAPRARHRSCDRRRKPAPGRGYSAAPLVTGHGVGEQCSIGSPGDNRDDDRRRTRSSPSEWSDTGARASGSGGRGCALACIDVSCARACVYVFGPAVTSSGGASRAPGTPSYLVGFARCYLLRELVVG